MDIADSLWRYSRVTKTFPSTAEVFDVLDGELCIQFLNWLRGRLPNDNLEMVNTDITSYLLMLLQAIGIDNDSIYKALIDFCKLSKRFHDTLSNSLNTYLNTKSLWAEVRGTKVATINTFLGDTFEPTKIQSTFQGGLVAEQLKALGWSQVKPTIWEYYGEPTNPIAELINITNLRHDYNFQVHLDSLSYSCKEKEIDNRVEEKPKPRPRVWEDEEDDDRWEFIPYGFWWL